MNITVGVLKKRLLSGTAIYVSDDYLDIAEAEVRAGGIRLTRVERHPFHINIKPFSYMEVRDELDRVLDTVYPDPNARPYRAAINLKNDYFFLRRFSLRALSETDLSKTVAYEVQKYIPFPIEDLAFSFKKCAKRTGPLEILFAASEKKYVNDAVNYFLTEKNILPSVIETAPAFITKGILSRLKAGAKAYLSLHYEPFNRVLVTGIFDRAPHFFRELIIPVPEDTMRLEALTYPTIKELWPLIAQDVMNTVEYLKKETSQQIETIFISGFMPSKDEQAVGNEAGIPLERITLEKRKGVDLEHRDRYLPVLALLEDSFSRPVLNLAPEHFVYQDPWSFRPVFEKTMIGLGLIVAAHFLLMGIGYGTQKEIESLKQQVTMYKVTEPDASRAEVVGYEGVTNDKATFISAMLKNRQFLTQKLGTLGRDFTDKAWINRVTFTNPVARPGENSFRIEGAIYGTTEENTAEINKAVGRIKDDAAMISGCTDVKLLFVRRKKIGTKEVTEFQIVLR
ncbi:MAG: pilus assembly protein PilM [Candidatus Omnitrophica bacterium]|nr:pilus assembly protein PilM [Candidatus Omnitrophota bacterium]